MVESVEFGISSEIRVRTRQPSEGVESVVGVLIVCLPRMRQLKSFTLSFLFPWWLMKCYSQLISFRIWNNWVRFELWKIQPLINIWVRKVTSIHFGSRHVTLYLYVRASCYSLSYLIPHHIWSLNVTILIEKIAIDNVNKWSTLTESKLEVWCYKIQNHWYTSKKSRLFCEICLYEWIGIIYELF